MPNLTVLERYGQVGEFAALLGAAELNAATDWDEQFLADLRSNFQRYGGHTIDDITVLVLRKDQITPGWLQSRFALSTDESLAVALKLLDDGVITLDAEGETPDLNTYRVTVAEKAPAEAPITLE
ncbi:hypothetical protein IPC749_10690 [Pseudomonas aeruginosa]|uniref:hypothetical protein n=1 Tax=Pseudomonas aeruginosa TaxID=287 RepID=UPI000BA03436|nr:hypothetical protein [Pseudomonas aeruginosa]OZO30659.1 hypothetical protein CGU39_07465 [Pseudomonas aeruginosa]RPW45377.1 hypothetical protein IPC749_10690 [Pseudomonas aeruginosa]RUG58414.1 hypothetical protein IPC750_11225 [Pseudomonas aeruginosa]UTN37490.1 hypothetical protein MMZ76_21790 [Pseudomonas aeruginosa]